MSDLAVKKQRIREMTQNVSHVSLDVAQQVTQFSNVITCLRTELNKDLPIQHIALLLAVVQQPGVSMQELMERLGMPQGSVSRNVTLLSTHGRDYELLRTEQDLVNRKQIVVFPTVKCVDLIKKLCGLMQSDIAEDLKLCRCSSAVS